MRVIAVVRLSARFVDVMIISQVKKKKKNHACSCHQRRNVRAAEDLTLYSISEQPVVKMDWIGVKTMFSLGVYNRLTKLLYL